MTRAARRGRWRKQEAWSVKKSGTPKINFSHTGPEGFPRGAAAGTHRGGSQWRPGTELRDCRQKHRNRAHDLRSCRRDGDLCIHSTKVEDRQQDVGRSSRPQQAPGTYQARSQSWKEPGGCRATRQLASICRIAESPRGRQSPGRLSRGPAGKAAEKKSGNASYNTRASGGASRTYSVPTSGREGRLRRCAALPSCTAGLGSVCVGCGLQTWSSFHLAWWQRRQRCHRAKGVWELKLHFTPSASCHRDRNLRGRLRRRIFKSTSSRATPPSAAA